ncbi:MAG: hypothetical protein QOF99_7139 [Pseudonocardiales bacterium]|jgi:hypothetical protein|nr:hypothetical protein [Pseudonocardiales bacterium]
MTTGHRITAGGVARTVAVVSDGSDMQGEPGSDVRTGLLSAAALLREHTGMGATAVLVSAESSEELIFGLRGLAGDISGVYLVHTDPVRGRAAQAALSGTLPVITDRQTLAVAALAATLTILTRADVAPAAAHAVIVGAERDRLVAELAVAAGIGEISSWGLDDGHCFPLHVLTRKATVVIDLLGSAAHRRMTDTDDPPTRVVSVDDPTVALLALPGLLAASMAAAQAPDLTACLACARALTECTPPDRTLPVLSDLGLGVTVVDIEAPSPPPTSSSVTNRTSRRSYRPPTPVRRSALTASAVPRLNQEPHNHLERHPRPDGHTRYVTQVTHAIDPRGVGHITVQGPAFVEHKVGIFNQAYGLAYDYALLHGFTNTDGLTTWTK